MRFNINDEVRIRLTNEGRKLIEGDAYAKATVKDAGGGWSRVQLWTLMSIFGERMFNGCSVPFETEIEIPEPSK